MNTAQHESTQASAAEINFGRNPAAPQQIRSEGAVPEEHPATPPAITELWTEIKGHLTAAAKQQKKYYDLRRRPWKPKVGEKVMKRDQPLSSAADNYAQKLAPKFSGPYIIAKYISTNTVKLSNPERPDKQQAHAHLQDLKPFTA
ncbi:uncharacterized protein LOC118756270 [Rhagoletis pomonella]|uniref:uncharacterized protein LOC118756270 n=1 Tax=Rhagoletis pomonella TaxID=28610 RepID=UPI00177FDCA7|nr:uncharacterized protein LOC118756270 [Rhagoletis pomonella]